MSSARDRIRSSTLELMARKGVAGTTTQDIARRANCSQAAIYKHWEGKDALALELFDEAQTSLIRAMEDGAARYSQPEERTVGSLQGLLVFARAFPHAYAFLFQIFHSDYAPWLTRHKVPRDVVFLEIQAAMDAGRIPAGNPGLKAALVLGMSIRLAFFERQNLIQGDTETIDADHWRAVASVLES